MDNSSLSIMKFVVHPLQSMSTVLRAWSTGLSVEKLVEYDQRIMEMAEKGGMSIYSSGKEAMNDIMGGNVQISNSQKAGRSDQGAVR